MRPAKVVLLIVTTFLLTITSCKNEDSLVASDDNKLIGTWDLTAMTENGVQVTLSRTHTVTLRNDKTFTSVRVEQGATETITGTWSTANNKLTWTNLISTQTYDYSFNSSGKMVITSTQSGKVYVEEYTKR